MSTSVHEVIEAFRDAPSNRERGTRFEELMVQYLKLDPLFAQKYSDVWMWQDWPGRQGKGDTGIDLVAKDRDSGEYTAIQCKFYEPTHTLAKADIDSFFTASGKAPFTNRIIISTTDKWGKNAEDACNEQQIPVQRIGLADIAAAPIDWDFAGPADELKVNLVPAVQHQPRPHQKLAIEKVFEGFETSDRGKLIMACGTGKTFTALKIAEYTARVKKAPATVLFLVPSISLLSQTLREWTAQVTMPMRSFAVCSDSKVGKRSASSNEDINVHDLALPATTDPVKLMAQVAGTDADSPLTVVFSTYQSIGVVAQAQKLGLPEFDLIICDEAHRTTGVTLADSDESQFVKVHDNTFVKGAKRLYMTATPRIFAEETKTKATENDAVITSMDEVEDYGPEFHRLGFGDAVSNGLLTDYKVLVLTVDEKYIAGPLQLQLADDNSELSLDDATKIVGCWNGLAKRTAASADGEATGFGADSRPMQRAVAFLRDIKSSKKLADKFAAVIDAYDEADEDTLRCDVHHVDGTYNALQRNHELDWLKAPLPDNECRILSNARCLSEGVDVPSLDAVLFLNPRNSVVDVVQSVGRVMRLADNKDYGYIILPVGVPAGMSPSDALSDNKRFKVVWQVLQALRAHDDRFNATVNKLELNKNKTDSILVGHVGGGDETIGKGESGGATEEITYAAEQIALFQLEDWRDAIFAKIVDKVGTRTYWEDWAKDVAEIAQAQEIRIQALLDGANPEITEAFDKFVTALKANLNDSITAEDAVSMLCQHLITKPVFDALFEGYDFATQNPVSKVMQAMVDMLHDQSLEAETQRLEGFYASVRMRASDIDNAEGKQRIIVELYEKFFKLGFKKTTEALGIVYTPVQIVDFIIRAANDVLQQEFGNSLSDEKIHILDPFVGTGTFIVRLLQSGLIKPEDMLRKYTSELHANEIMLLAYYIAAINIEATFHGMHGGEYRPFEGIVLTDTFQISEAGDTMDAVMFPQNNARIIAQQASQIRVIVGNPPYSVGQGSANDNNQNISYPTLDLSITDTYAKRSRAGLKRNLYDSYIRAFRWATDRIGEQGIVAFVSNGGWIDSNSADGLRLSLANEFSSLYVYNFRGNMRSPNWKAEGGQIFGAGSQATISVLIAVKNPSSDAGKVYYRDIGDFLTRDEKLAILETGTIANIEWSPITPNSYGDWINQRNTVFGTYSPIGVKTSEDPNKSKAVFVTYSLGLGTNRDAWCYNFSRPMLADQMSTMIQQYENARVRVASMKAEAAKKVDIPKLLKDGILSSPGDRISWGRDLLGSLAVDRLISYDKSRIQPSAYRPFCRQNVYFDRHVNNMVYKLPSMFPTPGHTNLGIVLTGPASHFEFTALVVDALPNLHTLDTGQFFPRWTYEKVDGSEGQLSLETPDIDAWGYRRIDNIADAILVDYRNTYGEVDKDDIFHYLYAMLHSPKYRKDFATDLKKILPRIPKVATADNFRAFARAGRELSDLHVGYEGVAPYPLAENVAETLTLEGRELYRVVKMAFKSKTDKSAVVYNRYITLTGIPDETHRYMLGPRSALEWLIDRYRVTTDKASGIVNDPNDWCEEHNNPRYIIDLVKRIVTVSVETMKIVDSLPELDLG